MLSETMKIDDSDIELEQELEELMKLDENVFPVIPNTKLTSDVDELEKSLKALHVESEIFKIF